MSLSLQVQTSLVVFQRYFFLNLTGVTTARIRHVVQLGKQCVIELLFKIQSLIDAGHIFVINQFLLEYQKEPIITGFNKKCYVMLFA